MTNGELNTARMFRQVALSFAVQLADGESTSDTLKRAQKFYDFLLKDTDGKAIAQGPEPDAQVVVRGTGKVVPDRGQDPRQDGDKRSDTVGEGGQHLGVDRGLDKVEGQGEARPPA